VRTAKKIKGELTSDPGPLAKLLDPLRLSSRKIGLSNSRFRLRRNFRELSNPTKPDKNYYEPGLMSMSPIRLIAYSLYTFSRFFN
jgi:hypothetical protein